MSDPKLTKKQKKSLAFRKGKAGPRKSSKNGVHCEDGNAIPLDENQDQAGLQLGDLETSALVGTQERTNPKGKGKEVVTSVDGGVEAKRKSKEKAIIEQDEIVGVKRKRVGEEEDKGEEDKEDKGKSKRRKGLDAKDNGEKVKQRFILFVGNLRFAVTKDDIKAHFAICDPPPDIRLMTPKPARPGQSTTKTKGCAFLEFSHRNALQQALKLHQSELQGRRINVELTAGGGGKSQARLTKLQQRNKQLNEQRTKKQEKEETTSSDMAPARPQRYSTTSGLEQISAGKRTWTVGDAEDGETHRGGVKHKKRGAKGGSKVVRDWGTGVNSIPVG